MSYMFIFGLSDSKYMTVELKSTLEKKEVTQMSVTMNASIEVGGLISREGLSGGRKLKPGTKLSAMKNAVYFQKKSGDQEMEPASLLRMTEEERKIHREYINSLGPDKGSTSDGTVLYHVNSSVFLGNDYTDTKENTNFIVNEKVMFTSEEMSKTSKVISDELSTLPKQGVSLDYRDYAKMGMVEHAIQSYAKENLNTEQAELVQKTVSDYMERLIANQPEPSYVISGQYYGKRVDDDVVQDLKKYAMEMVGKTYSSSNTGTQDTSMRIASASNAELASAVRAMFSSMEWEDEDMRQSVLGQYANQMLPAYLEFHDNSESLAQKHVQEDMALFGNYYGEVKNIVKAACMVHVDLHV